MGLLNISVLFGNTFSCGSSSLITYSADLPQSDFVASRYSCGSNDFNLAVILWLATLVIVGLFIMFKGYAHFYKGRDEAADSNVLRFHWAKIDVFIIQVIHICVYGKNESKELDTFGIVTPALEKSWADSTRTHSNEEDALILLHRTFHCIRVCSLYMAGSMLPLMLVYSLLKLSYGTFEFSYAFVLSISHLHGVVPTVIIVILCVSLLFICHQIARYKLEKIIASNYTLNEIVTIEERRIREKKSPLWTLWHTITSSTSVCATCVSMVNMMKFPVKLFVMGFVNVVVVVIVNCAFVIAYANSSVNNSQLFFISISLSIFKVKSHNITTQTIAIFLRV
jgi:hypothetical protein